MELFRGLTSLGEPGQRVESVDATRWVRVWHCPEQLATLQMYEMGYWGVD